jgi:hypothetical protein
MGQCNRLAGWVNKYNVVNGNSILIEYSRFKRH